MEMVANDPSAAKRVGIPQSVGEDFAKADEGKKFPAKRKSLYSHSRKARE